MMVWSAPTNGLTQKKIIPFHMISDKDKLYTKIVELDVE